MCPRCSKNRCDAVQSGRLHRGAPPFFKNSRRTAEQTKKMSLYTSAKAYISNDVNLSRDTPTPVRQLERIAYLLHAIGPTIELDSIIFVERQGLRNLLQDSHNSFKVVYQPAYRLVIELHDAVVSIVNYMCHEEERESVVSPYLNHEHERTPYDPSELRSRMQGANGAYHVSNHVKIRFQRPDNVHEASEIPARAAVRCMFIVEPFHCSDDLFCGTMFEICSVLGLQRLEMLPERPI
jgi:hypothetical protein